MVSAVSLPLSHWYPGSGVVLDVSIPDFCNLTYSCEYTMRALLCNIIQLVTYVEVDIECY